MHDRMQPKAEAAGAREGRPGRNRCDIVFLDGNATAEFGGEIVAVRHIV